MNIAKIACIASIPVLLAACSGCSSTAPQRSQSQQTGVMGPQQVEMVQQQQQRPAAPPMTLVMHCVTVKPPMPMQDPSFKAWVQKTMAAGKWCDSERVELTIVTSAGRTATKSLHLIGGEAIEMVPGDVVGEYPLNITVKPSGGTPVSMRIGSPVPGRAILMVSEKKS